MPVWDDPKTVVIWEKPDARRAAAAAGLPGLAARGHMFELAEPDHYGWTWEKFDFRAERPRPFAQLAKTDDQDLRKRHADFKAALARASRVIIATDSDREGERIARDLLRHYRFEGIVQRAWFSAIDASSLRQAFDRLRPGEETESLADASAARDCADWLVGMWLTRGLTKALVPAGIHFTFRVGRVKMPTAMIVYWREKARREFKAVSYYEIAARHGALELIHAPDPKLLDATAAQRMANGIVGETAPAQVACKRDRKAPPLMHSLDTLIKAASRWGWAAAKTGQIAQDLYEKGLSTYAGTDGDVLPSSQIIDIDKIVPGLLGLREFAHLGGRTGLPTPCRRAFDDAKLAKHSHHAIVPNVNTVNEWATRLGGCGADERKLFVEIATRYLEALGADKVFDRTTVTATIGGLAFKASGVVIVDPGWTALRRPAGVGGDTKEVEEEGDAAALPPIANGEMLRVESAAVLKKETTPPKRLTEGDLVEEMGAAHKYVTDPERRKRLKGVEGIGRPRTRGPTIEELKSGKTLKNEGKYITLTEAGWALCEMVERLLPELGDPGETAIWESRLEMVEKGRLPLDVFVDGVASWVQGLLDRVKAMPPLPAEVFAKLAAGGTPTDKMIEAAKRMAARKREKPPRGYTTDFETCRSYLDANSNQAPSASKLELARNIAAKKGLALPAEAADDWKACQAFLDAHGDGTKAANGPPTPNRLALAEKLAKEHGGPLPPQARADWKVCQAFIDKHLKPKGGRKMPARAGRR